MAEKDVILVVDGDMELVECPECDGNEGHVDDEDEWEECLACNGEGGYWRPVSPASDGLEQPPQTFLSQFLANRGQGCA
jgi:hypothetical protein